MSIQEVTHYAGPIIHKVERGNPTELIIQLSKKYPRATKEQIEARFLKQVTTDETLLTPCLRYYFLNAWNGLHPRKSRITRPDPTAVLDAASRLKAVIIGELMMPNGKKVRACTGVEMAQFGKFGAAVAKVAKRKIVGKVLSEKDLGSIWHSCLAQ